MVTAKIGIVTVSASASRGVYEDKGGPAIAAYLAEILTSPWEAVTRVIPDERPVIEETLAALADTENCGLILTTGGTGPAPRDVTPEATEAICDKMMPGFGELMRTKSLEQVPTGDPVAPNGRHPRLLPDRQPAGQARLDPRLHERRFPRNPILPGPDRRRAARDRKNAPHSGRRDNNRRQDPPHPYPLPKGRGSWLRPIHLGKRTFWRPFSPLGRRTRMRGS